MDIIILYCQTTMEMTALPCKEAQLIVHNAVCILLRNPCTVRFLNLLISHLPELFQRPMESSLGAGYTQKAAHCASRRE